MLGKEQRKSEEVITVKKNKEKGTAVMNFQHNAL
jgi:hypothetical protein